MFLTKFFTDLFGSGQPQTQNLTEGAVPSAVAQTDSVKPVSVQPPQALVADAPHVSNASVQSDQPQVLPSAPVREPRIPEVAALVPQGAENISAPKDVPTLIVEPSSVPSAPSVIVQKKLDQYQGGVVQNVASAFAHTFWPSKAAESLREDAQFSGKSTSTDREYAKVLNDKIVQEHPFQAMLGGFAGTIANIVLQGKFVPTDGISEAVQAKLYDKLPMDWIGLMAHTTGAFLSRVAGGIAEGGLRFGLNGLITEALDQAASKEFSGGKLATATAKSGVQGALSGSADAASTVTGQIVGGGFLSAAVPMGDLIHNAWKTGEVSSQDMVNVWVAGAVGAALHAMSADQTAAKNQYYDWKGYETQDTGAGIRRLYSGGAERALADFNSDPSSPVWKDRGVSNADEALAWGGEKAVAEYRSYRSPEDWARHNPDAARQMNVESALMPDVFDIYAQEFAKPDARQTSMLQSVPESFKQDFVRLPAATRGDIVKAVAEQVKDGTDLGIAVANVWQSFAGVLKFVHEAWDAGGAAAVAKVQMPAVVSDAVAQTQMELGQKPDAVRLAEEKSRIEAPAPVPHATRIPQATMFEASGGSVTPVQVSFDNVLTVQGDQYDLVKRLADAGAPHAAQLLKDFDYTEADQLIRQTLGQVYDAVRFTSPAVVDGKPVTQAEVFDISRNVYLSETPTQAQAFAEQGLRSAHQPYEAPTGLLSSRVKAARAATEAEIRRFADANELPVAYVRELFVQEKGQVALNPETGRPVRAYGMTETHPLQVTLADLRQGNTAKHEVAEWYWAKHVPEADKSAILDEMARKFSGLSRHDLKEQVMEEFTHWSDRKEAAGKVGSLFRAIDRFAKALKRTDAPKTEKLFFDIQNRVRPVKPEGVGRQEGFVSSAEPESQLRDDIDELSARMAVSAITEKTDFPKVEFQAELMVLPQAVVRSGEPIAQLNRDTEMTAAERFNLGQLQKLGSGSDRITYALDENLVLKVAKRVRGLVQNASEVDWFAIRSGLIPKAYETGKDYVVVQRAETSKSGKNRAQILAFLAPFQKYFLPDFDLSKPPFLSGSREQQLKNNDELHALMNEKGIEDFFNYDLLWEDFKRETNWGIIDGKPILIDAGTLNGRFVFDSTEGYAADWREILKRRREAKKADAAKGAAQFQSEQAIRDFVKDSVVKEPVYHGTQFEFKKFRLMKDDIGIHFGTKLQAEDRVVQRKKYEFFGGGEPYLVKAYISLKNPLRIEDVGEFDGSEVVRGLNGSKQLTKEQYQQLFKIRAGILEAKKNSNHETPIDMKTAEVRRLLVSWGFDGMVYRNVAENGATVTKERMDKVGRELNASTGAKTISEAMKMTLNEEQRKLLNRWLELDKLYGEGQAAGYGMASETFLDDSYIVFSPSQVLIDSRSTVEYQSEAPLNQSEPSKTVYRGSSPQGKDGQEGIGIWVTDDKEFASEYGKVRSFELPDRLNLLNAGADEAAELAQKFSPETTPEELFYSPTKEFVAFLKSKGFDGFVVDNKNILIFDKVNLIEPSKPLSSMTFSELSDYASQLAKENQRIWEQSWDVGVKQDMTLADVASGFADPVAFAKATHSVSIDSVKPTIGKNLMGEGLSFHSKEPIVVGIPETIGDKFPILDGNHRYYEALARGDKTVRVVIDRNEWDTSGFRLKENADWRTRNFIAFWKASRENGDPAKAAEITEVIDREYQDENLQEKFRKAVSAGTDAQMMRFSHGMDGVKNDVRDQRSYVETRLDAKLIGKVSDFVPETARLVLKNSSEVEVYVTTNQGSQTLSVAEFKIDGKTHPAQTLILISQQDLNLIGRLEADRSERIGGFDYIGNPLFVLLHEASHAEDAIVKFNRHNGDWHGFVSDDGVERDLPHDQRPNEIRADEFAVRILKQYLKEKLVKDGNGEYQSERATSDATENKSGSLVVLRSGKETLVSLVRETAKTVTVTDGQKEMTFGRASGKIVGSTGLKGTNAATTLGWKDKTGLIHDLESADRFGYDSPFNWPNRHGGSQFQSEITSFVKEEFRLNSPKIPKGLTVRRLAEWLQEMRPDLRVETKSATAHHDTHPSDRVMLGGVYRTEKSGTRLRVYRKRGYVPLYEANTAEDVGGSLRRIAYDFGEILWGKNKRHYQSERSASDAVVFAAIVRALKSGKGEPSLRDYDRLRPVLERLYKVSEKNGLMPDGYSRDSVFTKSGLTAALARMRGTFTDKQAQAVVAAAFPTANSIGLPEDSRKLDVLAYIRQEMEPQDGAYVIDGYLNGVGFYRGNTPAVLSEKLRSISDSRFMSEPFREAARSLLLDIRKGEVSAKERQRIRVKAGKPFNDLTEEHDYETKDDRSIRGKEVSRHEATNGAGYAVVMSKDRNGFYVQLVQTKDESGAAIADNGGSGLVAEGARFKKEKAAERFYSSAVESLEAAKRQVGQAEAVSEGNRSFAQQLSAPKLRSRASRADRLDWAMGYLNNIADALESLNDIEDEAAKEKVLKDNSVAVSEALAMATSEIGELRDEIQSWHDNMEGTGLENTNKFQEVSDALDSLEEIAGYADDVKADGLKANEVQDTIDAIRAVTDNEGAVSFPSMFQSESLKSRILGSVKPKPAEVVTNEYRLLKARVASFAEGVRTGRRDAVKELAELKSIVTESAAQLAPKDRAKLLSAVANAKTPLDVDKALGRIEVLADQAIRREAIASIKETGALVKAAERTGRYLPLDYQRRIGDIISGLDLAKPTQATIDKVAGLSEFLLTPEGSRWNVPQRYLDQLARFGKQNVSEISTADLKALAETLNHLAELGALKLKMLAYAGERERQAALQQLLTTTVNLDTKHGLLPTKWERAKAATAKLWYESLHFYRVTDAMDGMMGYLGQNTQLQRHVANAETRAKMDAMGVKSEVLKKVAEIKPDWTEADWARLAWHIYDQQGAVSQTETLQEVYGRHGDLSEPLSPELEAVRRILTDAFRPNEARLKAVYETIENRPFAVTQNYFPFRYEKTDVLEIPSVDEMLNQGGFSTKETEQGFTERRIKGVKKVPRIDLLNVFSSAIDDQMWYVNVQPALNDVQSLVNDPAYKAQAGRIATELWKDWLNAVAHHGRTRTDNPLLRILRQNVGQAYLGYSLTSIAIQPFAIFEAIAYIQQDADLPIGTSAEVLGEFIKNWTIPTVTGREVANSEMLQLRAGGEFAVEEGLAKFGTRIGDSALTRAAKAFQRGAMTLLQKADLKTSAATRQGIYNALVRRGVTPEKAAKKADFILNVVASSSETADRPLLLQKGEGWKAMFTFKTFALSKSGLLLHDLLMAGIVKGGIGKKAAALIGLLIVLLGNWLSDQMRQLLNRTAMGKKPLDQSGLKSPLMDAIFALPEAVPIVGDLLKGARQFGTADVGIPALRPIQDIFTGGVNAANAKTDAAKRKAYVQFATGFAALLGIAGTAQAARALPLLLPDDSAPSRGTRAVPKRTTGARPTRTTRKR